MTRECGFNVRIDRNVVAFDGLGKKGHYRVYT